MCKDYIETWFQDVVKPEYHSLLQHFLFPNQAGQLVSHIQVIIEVTISYVDMGKFLNFLRTLLHWKSSYT